MVQIDCLAIDSYGDLLAFALLGANLLAVNFLNKVAAAGLI